MTYRPAGSRSVDEILASSQAARERAAEAREGACEDIDRAAGRRVGINRSDGAAAAPVGVHSELSTPLPAEGETPPAARDGQAEQLQPAAQVQPAADVAVAVEPGHGAPPEPEAAAPADAGPGDADPGTAPPVQSGWPVEPSRTDPEPAGRTSQVAAPSPSRRTNAEKKQAVLALLRDEPSASDRKIARRVGCSPQTVGNVRKAAAQAEPAT